MRSQAAFVFLILLVCFFFSLMGLARLSGSLIEDPLPIALGASMAWALTWSMVNRGLDGHPHDRFGTANTITSVRGAMTLLLAACVPGTSSLERGVDNQVFWAISSIAAVALLLDAVDGRLARSSGLTSSFGARYDIETDAVLGLVIALLVWQGSELGIWVVMVGVLRYVFLLAGLLWPALQGDLRPSLLRRLVGLVQVGVLIVLLTPLIERPASVIVAAVALLMLVGSFVRDLLWLFQDAGPNYT